jgi:hypothetical protein
MNHDHQENGKWNQISKYVFWGFVLIAAYFLITEHRAHVVQYLPFLLLAACPLMHLFHGHGGHGGHGGDAAPKNEGQSGKRPDSEQHHHH